MIDRPILFSAPMVRALLDGSKTQTRRIFKGAEQNENGLWHVFSSGGGIIGVAEEDVGREAVDYLPIQVGDRLWVRESHAIVPRTAYRMSDGVQQTLRPEDNHDAAIYAAEWDRSKPGQWRPSIHMPRWASRLTLTVTDVRVERLQDISEADALAEGVETERCCGVPSDSCGTHLGGCCGQPEAMDPVEAYRQLWDEINGPSAWDANPWVAAYTFTVERKNIDEVPA